MWLIVVFEGVGGRGKWEKVYVCVCVEGLGVCVCVCLSLNKMCLSVVFFLRERVCVN